MQKDFAKIMKVSELEKYHRILSLLVNRYEKNGKEYSSVIRVKKLDKHPHEDEIIPRTLRFKADTVFITRKTLPDISEKNLEEYYMFPEFAEKFKEMRDKLKIIVFSSEIDNDDINNFKLKDDDRVDFKILTTPENKKNLDYKGDI